MINVFQVKAPSNFIQYNNISNNYEAYLLNINNLKIVLSNGRINNFDKFKQTIDELDEIQELQLDVDIIDSEEVFEVFQYLLNTAFPKFKNTLQQITLKQFSIRTNCKKSPNLSQKYLIQLIEIFENLDIISFQTKILIKGGLELQTLYDFLSINGKKSEAKISFKQLDIQIELDKSNLKLKDSLNQLPNLLSNVINLEGLSIDLNNLGLDQKYFQSLFQSIQKMNKLQKLCLNISKNSLTATNTVNCIQQISKISTNIQSLVYIDSQLINAQCMDKFVQGMKRFNNLKELYLQGISFSQNTGEQFFSIFSCYPQLEKLNLDFFECKINDEDFSQFVKNMQSLTKLHSLYLVLPKSKNVYSNKKSNVSQGIVKIIESLENQLISLQLEINERLSIKESNFVTEAICSLRKLKFLQIKVGGAYIQTQVDNQESIWNLMTPQISYSSYGIQLIHMLYNKIMLSSNSNMTSLTLEYSDEYEFKQEDFKKFTKMKSLTLNLTGYQINHYEIIKIIQGLSNSQNDLKSLILKAKIIDFSKIIEISKCFKELCFLSVYVSQIQPQLLLQLFKQLPFLQKLVIYESNFLFMNMDQNQKDDPYVFLEANYLTQFQSIQHYQVKSNELVLMRYAQILQQIAYQKLVQPELTYKPNQSHFDLNFD
ncbi:hypothetical protein ABPG74_000048 [Tetrahymena malaccensis]